MQTKGYRVVRVIVSPEQYEALVQRAAKVGVRGPSALLRQMVTEAVRRDVIAGSEAGDALS